MQHKFQRGLQLQVRNSANFNVGFPTDAELSFQQSWHANNIGKDQHRVNLLCFEAVLQIALHWDDRQDGGADYRQLFRKQHCELEFERLTGIASKGKKNT